MSTAHERILAKQKEQLESAKEPLSPKLTDIRSINKISQEKKQKLEIVKPQNLDSSIDKTGQVEVSRSNQGQASVSKYNNDQVTASKLLKVEVSPTKDFTKVSNSITKRAIPEKYFRGLSKHTYDVLYQKTRGAIYPTRTIQLTKDELVSLTGLSKDAVKLHIRYLKNVGLLKSQPAIGCHAGWEYEVFVPEEIETFEEVSVSKSKQAQGKASEILPLHSGEDLLTLTPSNRIENKEVKDTLKTSFKDNTKNDDEPYGAMIEVLAKACEKISGKASNINEKGKWKELAELLVMELEVASARTTSISNIPAFLTEHLRRRLMPVKREVATKSKLDKSSQVGKQPPSKPIETYKAEPLTEQGRESTLKTFAGYIEKGQKEFLMGLQDSYTKEDWDWLMKELKIA